MSRYGTGAQLGCYREVGGKVNVLGMVDGEYVDEEWVCRAWSNTLCTYRGWWMKEWLDWV